MTALCIGLFELLQFWAAGQYQMTDAESRKLVDAVLPTNMKNIRHLAIELEREHDGCVVYHAYQIRGTMTFPVGYWSIDTRTAEVWNDLIFERISNKRLARVQLAIRKRLGVTDNEQSASLSNPCYERDSNAVIPPSTDPMRESASRENIDRPTINNYGPPSPRVSWSQATEGPTVKVVFSVDDTMELPAFKATCDRPCNNVMSEATGNYEPVPLSFEYEPNSVGLTLRSPRPLGAGVRVLWVIRSRDERSITITDFRILEIGEVPAELRH
jgi:hypothetical protein